MTSPSDSSASRVLLRRACAGEGAALGELLERIRPWLRTLSARYLRQVDGARFDASDVVQQTCLSVHRRIHQFEGSDVALFMGWVRDIHRKNAIDFLRRNHQAQKRTQGVEIPLDHVPPEEMACRDSPGRPLFLGEEALELAAAVEQLPPLQRDAIRLKSLLSG